MDGRTWTVYEFHMPSHLKMIFLLRMMGCESSSRMILRMITVLKAPNMKSG